MSGENNDARDSPAQRNADTVNVDLTPASTFEVFVSPTRPIPAGGTFSPITSTLVLGRENAVLIDAQFLRPDVEALLDAIAASGRTLTAVVATHGHPDHCFGAGVVTARCPGARFVATPAVADYLRANLQRETRAARHLFGDDVVDLDILPDSLLGGVLDLEGRQLRLIDVGQADITPAAVVYVPDAQMVVAGDLAYNGVHPMLGYSRPEQWRQWRENVLALRELKPRHVVAGHKNPAHDDDAERVISETAAYIDTFAAAHRKAATPKDLVAQVMASYPEHLNPTTLLFSATVAMAGVPS